MTAASVIGSAAAGAARMQPAPAGVHARMLTLAEAGDLWRDLAADAAEDNVFFDPAFLGPAATGLKLDPLLLAVAGADGPPTGFLPLRRTRLGRVAPALEGFVPTTARWGRRSSPGATSPVPPAAAAERGRIVTHLDRHARAMLDREADGTDPRQTLPLRRRKEYGRQLRRLGEEGAVAVASATTPAEIAAAFEAYLALEAAGWKGRRGTALANRPEVASFARQATLALARKGACRVLTLKTGDRAAAILICLLAGRTATTWKIAYDETLARFSPGAQLMLEAPPILFADSRVLRIDSCAAPNHPMIDHLWPGRLRLTTLVIGPRRHRLRQAIGLGLHRIEQRARHWARDLRRGARPRPNHHQG